MLNNLISAIQFITILPTGKMRLFDPVSSIAYFPIVGLMIGGGLALIDYISMQVFTLPVVAVIDVIFLAIITGAFHLDGLGDTADGLFSHRTREQALVIMKDSRIGVMGVIAIISMLSLKWGGIMGLGKHRGMLLLLIPALARSSMIFGIRFLKYGRSKNGTGYAFFEKPLKWYTFSGVIPLMLLSVYLGWKAIYLWLFFGSLTIILLLWYQKKMGCITGDMLGAMTEFEEALLFLGMSVQ